MRAYIALFCLVALIPAVFSANGAIQFFPQWSNIDAGSAVQIMDLYIDHGFNAPNQNTNFLQNMTLCAAKGNDLTIGTFLVKLVLDNNVFVINKNITELVGKSFGQGSYKHCLQTTVPEYLLPGKYSLFVRIYDTQPNPQLIGGLNSNWTISIPKTVKTVQTIKA